MAIVNQIVVVVLLAGVVALSVAGALYSLDLLGYHLADLSERSVVVDWMERIAQGVAAAATGALSATAVAALLLVLLVGLVVLLLELWPSAPAGVQVTPGVYLTRRAVAKTRWRTPRRRMGGSSKRTRASKRCGRPAPSWRSRRWRGAATRTLRCAASSVTGSRSGSHSRPACPFIGCGSALRRSIRGQRRHG